MINGDKILFTADLHLFHRNIIRYQNRPFKDLDQMHEVIINNWNSIVDDDCTVYNLGDVSFGSKAKTLEILDCLKGNIVLIRGNHDRDIDKLSTRFRSIHEYLELREIGVVLCHYPILSWVGMHRGSIHLHGHSHGNLHKIYNNVGNIYNQKRLDVGIDCHNYKPITLNRVRFILDRVKDYKSIDHHDIGHN